MLMIPVAVNTVRLPANLDPRAAFAARVLLVTQHWLQGTGGITTGAQAAAIADRSRPTIDAARIVLQNGDATLLAQVLHGRIALTVAAAKVRRCVRLIESFEAASAEDRAAFGRMAGVSTVFDDVIMPAL